MISAITKWILVWVVTAVFSGLLGSVFSSLRVIALLNDIGAQLGFAKSLSMVLYDALYFGKLYILFIAIGFLIAFGVGTVLLWVLKRRNRNAFRLIVFTVAGAVSMSVMLWAMKNVFFGTQLVAGARDGTGFFLQILAGVLGGLLFALLTRQRPPRVS